MEEISWRVRPDRLMILESKVRWELFLLFASCLCYDGEVPRMFIPILDIYSILCTALIACASDNRLISLSLLLSLFYGLNLITSENI